MNQCSLCMTENHEQATVCKACGAMKMLVRLGYGFIAFAAFLGFTLPQKLMWVKHTLVP